MSPGIKIYRIRDFIRKNETGDLDYDRAVGIVHDLAAAALSHLDHNILIDVRETTLSITSITEVMKIALEFEKLTSVFRNRIATVVPNDADRVSMAKNLEACLHIKRFDYRVFTDFEAAIEWLSETEEMRHDVT